MVSRTIQRIWVQIESDTETVVTENGAAIQTRESRKACECTALDISPEILILLGIMAKVNFLVVILSWV